MQTFLQEHLYAAGFRSLFRKSILEKSGLLKESAFNSFAADTLWDCLKPKACRFSIHFPAGGIFRKSLTINSI